MLEDFIIQRIKAELPFEPNEEKNDLLHSLGTFLLSHDAKKVFILKGYAGTGKTTVMSALVRAMSKLKKTYVLLAPTGRAAKVLSSYSNAKAYTIHKQIYRQNQLGIETFSLAENKQKNTLFIVDEASMLSGQRDNSTFGSGCLLDDLITYVYSSEGCSLLLVGDNAQLPPVGSTISPALNADYMSEFGLNVHQFALKTVARQALESGILRNATRLRQMLNNPDEIDIQNIALETDTDVVKLQGEEIIETFEGSWRNVGMQDTLIITRTNKMTNLYNQGIRARVLWKEEENISNGDRIMVSKNNYFWTKEYKDLEFLANGDMFDIIRLYGQHEMYGFQFAKATLRAVDYEWEIEALLWLDTLTTDSPDANYQIQKELFARIAEDYPEIRNKKELTKKIYDSPYFNALQIRFAYAVTCHKAQGGQWKHVYIDTGGIAEDKERMSIPSERYEFIRWLYTATTRASEQIYILR